MELNSKTDSQLETGKIHDIEFAEHVEKSRQTIQNQVQEKIAKQEKKAARGGARAGAGRKRLSEAKPGADTEATKNESPIAPPPDISNFIAPPLVAISKIPAAKHGIPELALTPEEAMACAQSLNGVLNAFVPDTAKMDPKTASVIGCLVTVGSIGFQKYSIFQEKRKPVEQKQEEVQDKIANETQMSGMSSGDYFPKVRF